MSPTFKAIRTFCKYVLHLRSILSDINLLTGKIYVAQLRCTVPCTFSTGTKDHDSLALNIGEEPGPPPYGDLSDHFVYRPEVMSTIESTIAELDDELRELNLEIHGRKISLRLVELVL